MIKEFSVENYRSINDRVTLNMEASPLSEFPENIIQTERYKLLSIAAIYGANASGKSNILLAMNMMRNIVLNNFEKSSANPIPHDPFLLNIATSDKPTLYEVVFIIDNIKYRYGFEINNNIIAAEWLFESKKIAEKALFLRVADGIEVMSGFIEGKNLEEKTRDNALFLSVVDQFNGHIAKRIIRWFQNFNIISGLSHDNHRKTTFSMLEDPKMHAILTQYYSQLDLGFENIKVLKKEVSSNDFPSDLPEEILKQLITDLEGKKMVSLKTIHKVFDSDGIENGTIEFDTRRQESSGTNKMIDLSGSIFRALQNGGVVLIDELDAKLHPLLTLSIIKLFQNKDINNSNAQLIFATHDTNILNLSSLRRDQIYLVEKDKYGATDLYSLSDYKEPIRKDRSFGKDYINGRYGAIPYLGNLNKLW